MSKKNRIKEIRVKICRHYLKQQTWLKVLTLLLMTAYGATVPAAQSPSFSAAANGTINNLTVTAHLNVADADAGRNGNYYLAFIFQQTWYANNGTGWVRYDGGALPIYAAGLLANQTGVVVRNEDVSSLVGGRLYVGYGLTQDDMLVNGKYAMVYTVTADTTAPTVSGTINANGATNVPINIKVGATFSEKMDPLTINTTTLSLMQGATAVPGTVSYAGVNAVFVPLSTLAPSTFYTVTVKGGVSGGKDLAGNPLARDYVWNWTTGAAPDTTPPTVSGTLHANGATDVAINTKVGATFSEGMDPLTITTTTLFLMQGATAVPGTVSYSGVSAVFIPSSTLTPSTAYTVTVKGGVSGAKDLAGNPMAGDFVVNWTTSTSSDTTPPTVSGTINANGATNVAINTKVGATFSEGMDPLTITNVNFTLKETVSGNEVLGTIRYSGVNAELRLAAFAPTPLYMLLPNTGYTATIKGGVGGVADLAGNPMVSDYEWNWTTGAEPDTIAPTITLVSPADLAQSVAINSAVSVTFSEAMYSQTINTENFTVEGVTGVVTYDVINGIATFTPSGNLTNNTSYTATVTTGTTDLAGNTLENNKVWRFTTAAIPSI